MYNAMLNAALASAREEDLRRTVRDLRRRHGHGEVRAVQPRPARAAAKRRRLSRAALVLSRS
jgi:hypothetical protein